MAEDIKPQNPQEPEEKLSIVDEAKRLHELIKGENDRRENILKEEQKLQAENMLGGTTGGNVKAEPKEVSPTEYVDRIMAGEIPDDKA